MTSVVLPKVIKGLVNPKSLRRWSEGVRSRLPDHYRKRMINIQNAVDLGTNKTVHTEKTEGLWKPGHHPDTLLPIQNRPIPIFFPPEADEGLWGGEGIIKGYVQRRHRAPRAPKVWVPQLKRSVLYSEILDTYMNIIVTDEALMLIDESHGLDYYILKTPEADFHSNLALKLKQRMLLALLDRTLYPNDGEKRDKIYKRYIRYLTYNREELEWLGLSEEEAVLKQEAIDREKNKPLPLKYQLTDALLERIGVSKEEFIEKSGVLGDNSIMDKNKRR